MKSSCFIPVTLSLTLLFSFNAYAFDRVPLGTLRQKYVGHTVMILPSSDPSSWVKVKEKKGHFEYAIFGTTGTALAGANGQVVAVEEYDGLGEPRGANNDSQMIDSFRVIVRLASGEMIACTTSVAGMVVSPYFADTEVLRNHAESAEAFAKGLSNRDLFLTARSYVYDVGLTPGQASSVAQGVKANSASITGFPRLKPVRIADYEYIPRFDLLELKLGMPNGTSAIAIGQYEESQHRWTTSLLATIPASYTLREIEAIQKGEFFIGMSEMALWDSLGLPEKMNDYGKGGQQWVYGGDKYVYLAGPRDSMRVVDMQSLN